MMGKRDCLNPKASGGTVYAAIARLESDAMVSHGFECRS